MPGLRRFNTVLEAKHTHTHTTEQVGFETDPSATYAQVWRVVFISLYDSPHQEVYYTEVYYTEKHPIEKEQGN